MNLITLNIYIVMKHLYILTSLLVIFSFNGHMLAQEPLTDRIVIEFMEPGDPDAEARNYHLLPWPEEAKAPAYKAAEIWASYLEITVPIRVKFGWCDNLKESNARGGATYSYQYSDGYYYPLSLLNQLLGYDRNKDVVDIICVFKSNIENGWYFGMDGKVGLTPDPNDPLHQFFQEDFVTVAMHEICHGLGFTSSMEIKDGRGKWGGSLGKARIYDTFLCTGQGHYLTDLNFYSNNSIKLAEALTSDNIYWSGTYATTANNGIPIKIYAPTKWSSSSISHLDIMYARTENNVMAYGLGGTLNADGLGVTYYHGSPFIILGMLQDIGWSLKSTPTANENIEATTSIQLYTCMNQVIVKGIEDNIRVIIFDISGRVVYSGLGPNQVTLPKGVYIAQVDNQAFKINLR